MQLDNTLYSMICESVITDVYTGTLKKGDRLPPLDTMCLQYDVGHNTMRAALRLLAERGFVRTEQGRTPIVIFDFDDSVQQGRYISSVLRRRASIFDVFTCLELLMPDLVSFCCRQGGAAAAQELRRMVSAFIATPAAERESDLMGSLLKIYRKVLSYARNAVLIDITEQMIRFVLIPVSADHRKSREYRFQWQKIDAALEGCIDAALRQDDEQLHAMVTLLCRLCGQQSRCYLQNLTRSQPQLRPAQHTSSFSWRPVREQEYLYSQLVVELLHSIQTGEYQAGELLPSYAQMSKRYGVSQRTARRAVSILNQIHILTTVNGYGSVVQPAEAYESQMLSRDDLVWDKLLHFFEAVQILAITCRPIVRAAMTNITLEDVEAADAGMHADGRFTLGPLLRILVERSGSPALATIYQQLRSMMIWGCCIDLLWPRPDMHAGIRELGDRTLDALRAGDAVGAEDGICELYQTIYQEESAFFQRMHLDVPPLCM